MSFPFEVPFDQVQADLEIYVDKVFAALLSSLTSSIRKWLLKRS